MNPTSHTAMIWGSGDVKFSATPRAAVGLAVARLLAKPAETANRSICISSFETTMNEVLSALKKATGVEGWSGTHVDQDEQIKIGAEEMKAGRMMGMGKLVLAVEVKQGLGPDFKKEELLENESLGLPHEDVGE